MFRKKEKKGSHIGIVLSFTLFVGFVFFFYSMVQPILKYETKSNQIELLRERVIKETSKELNSFSVRIDWSGQTNPTCVKLVSFIDEVNIGEEIIVRNNENALDFYLSGSDLFVKTYEDPFIKVYESSGFEGNETEISGCAELNKGPSGYLLGLIRTEERVFEAEVIRLIDEYSENYEDVKERLAVPKGNDFGIGFSYSNGTELGFSYIDGIFVSTGNSELTPPQTANVFVDEIPIEYISADASRKIGTLKIILW